MATRKGQFHGRKSYGNLGAATFKAYCDIRNLDAIERKQHYTATDLIVDVLHFARRKGWDAAMILNSASNHLEAETVEHCPKCGIAVTREWAIRDEGTGEESGRTFYYCSDECKEKH